MGIRRTTCGIGGFVLMDNKQILEKAIQKAIGGGWEAPIDTTPSWIELAEGGYYDMLYEGWLELATETIIFSHDFAKALWGEKRVTRPSFIDYKEHDGELFTTYRTQPNDEYHLQQMVISDNPIQYLKENI